MHTQRTVFWTVQSQETIYYQSKQTEMTSPHKITAPFVVSYMVSMLVVVLPKARLCMLTTSLTDILSLLFFSFMCPPCCLVLFLFPPWPLLNPDSPNKVRNSFHLYCSQQCHQTHRVVQTVMIDDKQHWLLIHWQLNIILYIFTQKQNSNIYTVNYSSDVFYTVWTLRIGTESSS